MSRAWSSRSAPAPPSRLMRANFPRRPRRREGGSGCPARSTPPRLAALVSRSGRAVSEPFQFGRLLDPAAREKAGLVADARDAKLRCQMPATLPVRTTRRRRGARGGARSGGAGDGRCAALRRPAAARCRAHFQRSGEGPGARPRSNMLISRSVGQATPSFARRTDQRARLCAATIRRPRTRRASTPSITTSARREWPAARSATCATSGGTR